MACAVEVDVVGGSGEGGGLGSVLFYLKLFDAYFDAGGAIEVGGGENEVAVCGKGIWYRT